MCETRYSEKKPPAKLAKSINRVSIGKMRMQATILVTTNILKASTDKDSIASICSVTRILAIPAPMPAPTFPATSSPVTSGPSSLKNEADCRVGIIASAPNCTSVARVCIDSTIPRAKPAAKTSGRDCHPISSV